MKELFSERNGYIIPNIQVTSLNERTRNRLWDIVKSGLLADHAQYAFWPHINKNSEQMRAIRAGKYFLENLYCKYFGKSISDVPTIAASLYGECRRYFLESKWFVCFDFIEVLFVFAIETFGDQDNEKENLNFIEDKINIILAEERCSYRILSGIIMPVTNDIDLSTIGLAIQSTISLKTVNTHLLQAVKLFSDRDDPDYRNSIKESISAVESLLKLVVGSPKVTMSDALKLIKHNNQIGLHPALQSAMVSLYAWAGDEDGIRHGSKNESVVDSDDAKFILVTCSCLVSYLIAKSSASGLSFISEIP